MQPTKTTVKNQVLSTSNPKHPVMSQVKIFEKKDLKHFLGKTRKIQQVPSDKLKKDLGLLI